MKKKERKSNEMFSADNGILGYLLRKASGTYKQKMDEVLNSYKITAPQFTILSIVYHFEGCSNADLARLALLTPQTVSLILVRLEKMQLIERIAHASYKRVRVIKLSSFGESVFKSCNKVIEALELSLEEGFTDEEIVVVRRWLGEILEK